jgi:redox-sensing transcriptional repressor
VLADRPVAVGILAVPAEEAQEVATRLVGCGVRGLVNFAPALLHLPPGITCEDMDIAVSLEKVAYFARQGRGTDGPR